MKKILLAFALIGMFATGCSSVPSNRVSLFGGSVVFPQNATMTNVNIEVTQGTNTFHFSAASFVASNDSAVITSAGVQKNAILTTFANGIKNLFSGIVGAGVGAVVP